MTKPLKLYSKTSVEKDWKCPRSYYWGYEFDGTGIQAQEKGLALMLGTALHDGLAFIAFQWKAVGTADIDLIATTAFQQVYDTMEATITDDMTVDKKAELRVYAAEQGTMVEGILRGFYKHVWPKFMAEYDIWMVEEPLIYTHGQVGMMTKADLILSRKDDDSKWYLEYKSTSSKKTEWIKSWETAVQVHSSIRALQQAFPNEEFGGVIIQGLYKGYESYGRQNSPFCYAYAKYGQPPFTQTQYRYEYLSGWKKQPVWEMEGGVKKWVEEMPDDILVDQFPQTPPIFVNDDLIEAFFRQQETRQAQIARVSNWDPEEHWLDDVFPQRFDQCAPAYGFGCPYKVLCHGSGASPYDLGFVKRSTEHLAPFLEKLDAQS